MYLEHAAVIKASLPDRQIYPALMLPPDDVSMFPDGVFMVIMTPHHSHEMPGGASPIKRGQIFSYYD
jgi:hypothetical protein